MKRIIFIVLSALVLTMVPATQASAQYGHIETPKERKEREAREAEARKKKQQQEAAARRQREEEARKKREAEAAARRQREAEERERQRVLRELEANMVYVEGGTFIMGDQSPFISSAKPDHQVTLSSFHICKYEVTQELWQAVMGYNPSEYRGSKRPVDSVSWEDCQTFITKLNQLTGKNYRLPTEAEWEYAARGGNRSNGYEFAGSNSIDDVGWYYDNSSILHSRDVGMKRANELGLYDMTGNVEEWCQDWGGDYSSSSQTNPRGPSSGTWRVNRGGCFISDAGTCNVDDRGFKKPTERCDYIGLRLAL